MLTVKILICRTDENSQGPGGPSKRFTTKIVEAVEVDIHHLRHDELSELHITHPHGGPLAFSTYYIANRNKPRPEGFANDIDFSYYAAYIENASGKTVDRISFD